MPAAWMEGCLIRGSAAIPAEGTKLTVRPLFRAHRKSNRRKPMAKDEHNNAVELPDNATAQHGNHA
jgi:hypothetical protein